MNHKNKSKDQRNSRSANNKDKDHARRFRNLKSIESNKSLSGQEIQTTSHSAVRSGKASLDGNVMKTARQATVCGARVKGSEFLNHNLPHHDDQNGKNHDGKTVIVSKARKQESQPDESNKETGCINKETSNAMLNHHRSTSASFKGGEFLVDMEIGNQNPCQSPSSWPISLATPCKEGKTPCENLVEHESIGSVTDKTIINYCVEHDVVVGSKEDGADVMLQPVTKLKRQECLSKLQIPLCPEKVFDQIVNEPMFDEASFVLTEAEHCKNVLSGKISFDEKKETMKAPGIDGQYLVDFIIEYNKDPYKLIDLLHSGNYRPSAVRRAYIRKPNGKKRPLGILTVKDKLIQKATQLIIEPLIDPFFSPHSHGFRHNLGIFTAAREVKQYSKSAKYVVSIDLSQYFDKVNHDKLMRLFRNICPDKRLCKLIRDILKAGVVERGKRSETNEGVPQGGVISPLLANLYLHELDKELTCRGLRFVRYADDFVIFANSKRSASRILRNTTRYLQDNLKLEVNVDKSKIVLVHELEYLGLAFKNGIQIQKDRLKNFKGKLLRALRKNVKPEDLPPWITGWFAHYGQIDDPCQIRTLDRWFHEQVRQSQQKRYPYAEKLTALWTMLTKKPPNWRQVLHSNCTQTNSSKTRLARKP